MFDKTRNVIAIFPFIFLIPSCNGMKKEGHHIIGKAKQTISEEKSNLGDKIIAHFDSYHPDTKFNQKRFSEFFMFHPTTDVKNIYCYADELGIDHSYQFAFNCNSETVSKIVSNLKLNQRGVIDDNDGSGFWQNFPWWDSSKIKTLQPFSKKGEHEIYWYLWYDSLNQKAYYFTFDM